MFERPNLKSNNQANNNDRGYVSAPPAVSLPKGGNGIKGMGEKFAANPVTGTGSMTVLIDTSSGRAEFGPQLTLSYDSGAGNGIFGFGWNLAIPAITRKTDKGLPRYWDESESDVFILSGAEDLVPVLVQDEQGQWQPESIPPRTVDGKTYQIRRYRPRIEGLFALIERWTNQANPQETFWRSLSKDNITTWYGRESNSRIVDPDAPTRIFSWLLCESYDDKGNVIVYRYKEEDATQIDLAQAHERNRSEQSRSANRYLKRIRYGNRQPYLPELLPDQPWPIPTGANASDGSVDWFFEVVFDYGEHDPNNPKPNEAGQWDYRPDPFSSYRAGFEVRTYRLCQRVLMFHNFPDEAEVGQDCLVRATDFTYSYEQNPSDARAPIYSQLISVTQTGYKRNSAGGYIQKSMPPLEFTYSKPEIDGTLRDIDPVSLENLPVGLDGAQYQWVDLDGEGLSGILTEQGEGWFYKRNLSPVNAIQTNGSEHLEARFAAVTSVGKKPAMALANGAQFLDLAGDGQLDLVTLRTTTPGFYERTPTEAWESFIAFKSIPAIDWDNPNLKLIDLNGDGHNDILITEDDCFVWYPSLAEDGFGVGERSLQPWDEEKGPRIVFADGTQSIYLADLSGDGLTDIARIRNGEVCYWPNLGYGKFGAKVTMDNAPWFDAPDIFDQRRIVLADIDGSGTTDILYLSSNGVQIYFNQSGNSWSAKQVLPGFPAIDNLASVTAIDLLGNGTACLVWSSSLPGYGGRVMRYIDLMGSQKPHLLIETVNNLGAKTSVKYAPSTKFYLQDKLAGKPWITKIPFPVHVVEKVTVTDKWRKTSFSTTYSYHHGYFDGIEREFRGFGRVEQVDIETYGEFEQGNTDSPYITDDKTLYQPPVKTVTWYHTGAMVDRDRVAPTFVDRILSQFSDEYFPHWFEDLNPNQTNVLGDFQENSLPEPDLVSEDLSTEEWREALRACKGMMLRQEVYELDVDAWEQDKQQPVKLYSTAYHNCHIQMLQPRLTNRHGVFLVTESEAIAYHYELDLTKDSLKPDPRIAHTLNLKIDEYGNVLQSVAVVYPRIGQHVDETLPDGTEDLIAQVQGETHLTYTETRYTNDVGVPSDPNQQTGNGNGLEDLDRYRLRLPCEVLTYELTGISPEDESDLASADPRDNRYFTLDELRRYQLSDVYKIDDLPESEILTVAGIAYHEIPNRQEPQKRIVEHVRMLYFQENLSEPLPLGELNALGLPYETYTLALTDELLNAIFGAKLTTDVRNDLDDEKLSGYLSGTDLDTRFPGLDNSGQYWIRSGIAGFAPDAAEHFYLPERYTDPFGQITTLEYDSLDLFVKSSTDPVGNTVTVTQFNYRVLAPQEMKDINGNLSEVKFDVLGLPTAMALKGKGEVGDSLEGMTDDLINLDLTTRSAFFTEDFDEAEARRLLDKATTRHIYYFGEESEDGKISYGKHPPCAAAILREQHVAALEPEQESPVQVAFEYSDGGGNVLVTKAQAEPEIPGGPLRWVASGKTILNNKGKPVKQYEPYFSKNENGQPDHRFEEPMEVGVTPIMYYDAVGRLIRTELPDGSFSQVEFSPWHVTSYDPNDTVLESNWYSNCNPPDPAQPLPTDPITGQVTATPEQRAAWLAAQHANTPSTVFLDSLGREVIGVAHNRFQDSQGVIVIQDRKYVTFTKLDAEGKPLWIRDDRGNLVMQYITPVKPSPAIDNDIPVGSVSCYDIAGNLLFQYSMDAGGSWLLNDSAGQPFYAWDDYQQMPEDNSAPIERRRFHTVYDALRRPLEQWLQINNDPWQVIERIIYGDLSHPEGEISEAQERNLRGQVYQHYDSRGLVTNQDFDFKGNLREVTRQLISDYKAAIIDWAESSAISVLESEVFTSSTEYDALNRPTSLITPYIINQIPPSEIKPTYNEANLLEKIDVRLRDANDWTPFARNINYNAKGQRELIQYATKEQNNYLDGLQTEYQYDPQTFRLSQLKTTRTTDNKTLQNLHYTYDPVGNITAIRDDAQQTIYFNGEVVSPHSEYIYDALYRLIEAKGREHIGQNSHNQPQHHPELKPHYDFNDITRRNLAHPHNGQAMRNYTQKYEYDSVGNIMAMIHQAGVNGWQRDYEYAADSNRLLRTSLPSSGNSSLPQWGNYSYDTHGNMTKMPHLNLMQWDYKDRLRATAKQVVNTGGTPEITYYVYDASGERVRKVTERQTAAGETPTRKNERIYLGWFEIYRQYGGDGSTVKLERETLHIMDDQQRIALVETKTIDTENTSATPLLTPMIRYQLGNHLGSVSLELDAAGAVISYEEYHPYGTTAYQAGRNTAEVGLKRYRYTGKERDEETGLAYHGARYYSPWLGRWIAVDPLGLVDGGNFYHYTKDNPLKFKDLTGTKSATYDRIQKKYEKEIKDRGITSEEELMGFYQEKIRENLDKLEIEQKKLEKIINKQKKWWEKHKISDNPVTYRLIFNSPNVDLSRKETDQEAEDISENVVVDQGVKVVFYQNHFRDKASLHSYGAKIAETIGAKKVTRQGEVVEGTWRFNSNAPVISQVKKLYEKTGQKISEIHLVGHTNEGLDFSSPRQSKELSKYVTDDVKIVWHGCYACNYFNKTRQQAVFKVLPNARIYGHRNIKVQAGMPWALQLIQKGGERNVTSVTSEVLPKEYVQWWASKQPINFLQRVLRHPQAEDDVKNIIRAELNRRSQNP